MARESAVARPVWTDLKSLPLAFWVLCVGTFINRAGLFVYPFLTIVMARRGFLDSEIGLALGGYGLGALAAAAWGGWWADRFGRKASIVLGCFLNGLSVIFLGQISTLPLLCLLTSLAGFANAFAHPALSAFVADVVAEPLRLRAFAVYRMALNAGFFCGMAVGGWLVNVAPAWLFWGDALTTWIFGAIAAFLLPNVGQVGLEHSSWRVALRQLRTMPGFVQLIAMEMCLSLLWAQFSTTFARHLQQTGVTLEVPTLGLHYSTEQVFALILGWNGLLIVSLELGLTRWTQRWPALRVLIWGFLLQGLGFLGYALPFGAFWLLGCMTLFTVGEMIFSPVHSTFVAKLLPQEIRGRSQGILQSAQCTMRMTGPSLGFWALQHGPWVLWGGCFAVAAIGAACAWRIGWLTSRQGP